MSTRFSRTTGERRMYLATPILRDSKILGVVRTSVSIEFIDRALRTVQIKIAMGGLVIVLLVAGISWVVSRRISRPLAEMKLGAEQFAWGDLTGKIPVNDSTELGGLAETLNQMARQLDDRIRTVTTQRNEREAIFSSMVEVASWAAQASVLPLSSTLRWLIRGAFR